MSPAARSRVLISARLALNLFLFTPFIVLYAGDLGLDFRTVLLVESMFALLITITDLPCGHLADRIGPKWALLIGGALQGTACALLYALPAPAIFWGTQVLFAFAVAISRGADSALNFAQLKAAGAEATFEASESRLMSLLLVGRAIAYVAGGFVATLGYRQTFLATACVQLVGVGLLLLLPGSAPGQQRARFTLQERLGKVWRACMASPDARRQLLLMVLAGSSFQTILYLAPALARSAGIDTYELGAFFALATLGGSGAWFLLRRYRLGLAYVMGIAGFLLMGTKLFIPLLIGTALVEACQTLIIPRFRAIAMGLLGEYGEATAMSVVSTAMLLGFSLLGPLLGHISDLYGLNTLLYFCCGMFCLTLAIAHTPRKVQATT